MGNPLWVNHVNRFHEMLMVSMIKYMSLYNIPLEEDGACAMFRKLAIQSAKMDGRSVSETGRWNGVRNDDGSTTGNYQSAIVCGHHFFMNFLKRNPAVRKYRTATMSIVRAKKATPEVFVCVLSLADVTLHCDFDALLRVQIRRAHYEGFVAFLDRLVRENYLTADQASGCQTACLIRT